jgi:hypothetical protein
MLMLATTRSSDKISDSIASVFAEYFKTSERTLFWDDNRHGNIDPFRDMPGGYFAAHWDMKVGFGMDLQLWHRTDFASIVEDSAAARGLSVGT